MGFSTLDWSRDGLDWPNRQYSRFLHAGAAEWHVQVCGPQAAPGILLLHGTGASCHSFRDMLPILAGRYRVVAPDLPGHAFTRAAGRLLSLDAMAGAVLDLCKALEFVPLVVAGHSAGAAVALQASLTARQPPATIVGFNAALEPIEGDHVYAPLARMLFLNPFVPRAFASFSRFTGAADRLLDRTGSRIDERGRDLYGRLLQNPAHVAGALGMMANWDLAPLRARFGAIPCRTRLVATRDDPMVPASVSEMASGAIRNCEYVPLPSGGHLFHEERPAEAAALLIESAEAARKEQEG